MKISARRTLVAAILLAFGLTAFTLGWVGPFAPQRPGPRLSAETRTPPPRDAVTEAALRQVEALEAAGREDEARRLARELLMRGVEDARLTPYRAPR